MTKAEDRPLLSLREIRKSYGATEVLHGIDFEIYAGEVVALLGENGAGKSTISGIIAGSKEPTSGEMTWLGQAYRPQSPREAIDLGVGLIHQELRLLPHLSIAENVYVGRYPQKNGCVNRSQMIDDATAQLKRLGLNIPATQKVEGLSTANQQLIEIAKALALGSKLLILDEPTAALGVEESELLFKQIDKLRDEGVGIIYISHRLEEIKRVANRIVVFRDGSKVEEFSTADLPVRTIVEAMVGRSLEQMFPPLPVPKDEVVLEVKGLTASDGSFENVNFAVHRGEILGIAGLVGAGRTEVVRAIAGADPIRGGEIILHDEQLSLSSPADAIKRGIVMVPEDRKLQGLVLEHSIEENIGYSNFESVSKAGWVSRKAIKQFAQLNIQLFGVKGLGYQNADEMSGGNQQKVVLAKWLARKPRVVVLDEPTRGIDVGARSSIYELIHKLAEDGVAVIVVSSDLEEVLGVSNRIMVMAQGKQAGILHHDDANDVSVMELATL